MTLPIVYKRVIVQTLHAYKGTEESTLTFNKGELVHVLNQLESGWWDGVRLPSGERGWFPSNYVVRIDSEIVAVGNPAFDQVSVQTGSSEHSLFNMHSLYDIHRDKFGSIADSVVFGSDMAGISAAQAAPGTLSTQAEKKEYFPSLAVVGVHSLLSFRTGSISTPSDSGPDRTSTNRTGSSSEWPSASVPEPSSVAQTPIEYNYRQVETTFKFPPNSGPLSADPSIGSWADETLQSLELRNPSIQSDRISMDRGHSSHSTTPTTPFGQSSSFSQIIQADLERMNLGQLQSGQRASVSNQPCLYFESEDGNHLYYQHANKIGGPIPEGYQTSEVSDSPVTFGVPEAPERHESREQYTDRGSRKFYDNFEGPGPSDSQENLEFVNDEWTGNDDELLTPVSAVYSTAESPLTSPGAPDSASMLPFNWGKKETLDGRVYYFNKITDDTTWSLEDIDPITGDLLRAPEAFRTELFEQLYATRLPFFDQSDLRDRWTLTWLSDEIYAAMSRLSQSLGVRKKERYIPQAVAIVEAIRVMLYSTGMTRTDGQQIAPHPHMIAQHRQIMRALSNLVVDAKQASNIWPAPDSVVKTGASLCETFTAVAEFVANANIINIPITLNEVALKARDALVNNIKSWEDEIRTAGKSSTDEKGPALVTQPDSQSNVEVVTHLERLYTQAKVLLTSLIGHLNDPDDPGSDMVGEVRLIVTEIGNFLSVVEELPLDNLKEESTIDFKVNRVSLVTSISDLVMTTQTASSPLAPSNALEQVLNCASLVEKSIRDLLITIKYMLEDRIQNEQGLLSSFIESRGIPRRATDGSTTLQGSIISPQIDPPRPGALSTPQNAEAGTSPTTTMMNTPVAPTRSSSSVYGMNRRSNRSNSVMTDSDAQHGSHLIKGAVESYRRGSVAIQQSDTPEVVVSDAPLAQVPTERILILEEDIYEIIRSPTFGFNPVVCDIIPSRPRDPSGSLPYEEGKEILFTHDRKIKAGTLNALLERLTCHDTIESGFNQTFMLTYRSFTTTTVLFDYLIDFRFNYNPDNKFSANDLDSWAERRLTPIRLRVFSIIKSWLEVHCEDNDEDRRALDMIRMFVSTRGPDHLSASMRVIGKALYVREAILNSGREDVRSPTLQLTMQNSPPPILPKTFTVLRLLNLDPLEVARQLTLITSEDFCRLKPWEFLSKAWSDNTTKAKNVKSMINMSNMISGWVVQSILMETEIKRRSYVIKYFIAIADYTRRLNNFNTLMAILAGLNSSQVFRLKRTWELIGKSQQTFESLQGIMNQTKNRGAYREALRTAQPPCIPFLGQYLTDLTFIADGNPDYVQSTATGNQLINYSKRTKTAEIILEIKQYQNQSYNLVPVLEVQRWIRGSFTEIPPDSVLYEQSLALEPKDSNANDTITKALMDSGIL
ncbi:ras guanine nucleotide exchange factor domain-containing protein [Polychytrium aggregatum]|uniref:ras guanine nucleotide exchange factor domain-containing protein n=1 Tax=Polychytrium aggregatum TaxID=110093 RepID=UPI0022FE86F9|nr:ras guanine nucleotide exchange factor domain-containing protein [Polychytrium aggregatum]KAI9197088.1 ras guanine nucleotide exchange factor domain-containing protein [Polychytrium aggregatum]